MAGFAGPAGAEMSAWSELERAAMLGTRRTRPKLPPIAPSLDRVLNQLESDDPAHDLLRAAGMLELYEQAGRIPARLQADRRPPPAAEERPPCPPAAARYLAQMLDSNLRDLLPEFLGALDGAGYRLPETLLPNMLAHGYTRSALRPLILPLIGNRGRRLAARHKQWHYAAVDPHSWQSVRRAWERASAARRPSLVAQLRAMAPDQGRALLESGWRAESDQQRLRLIKQLLASLSAADEPLLETALDDRSRLVRRQAADLLARIPGSRLSARVSAYVPRYLAWTPGETRQITVRLPQVTPAMRRDGVTGALNAKPAHARSQEIVQLIGSVPLAYWQEAWGCRPRELLEAIPSTAWPRTLTSGFALAAERQEDAAWSRRIIEVFGVTPVTTKLIPVLSPADLRALTLRSLASERVLPTGPGAHTSPLLNIVRRWPGPWDVETAARLVELFAARFRATAHEKRANAAALNTIGDRFLSLARQAEPELLPEAQRLLGDTEKLGCWRSTAREFLYLLSLRREMLEVLSERT